MSTGGLENNKRVAYHEYDFAKDGGAVGNITLRGNDLPDGAIILNSIIDVEKACTSGGSATLALKVTGTADVKAATAVASFSLAALLDGVPVNTAATAIRVGSGKKTILTVAVAALTGGKFTVAHQYITPRD